MSVRLKVYYGELDTTPIIDEICDNEQWVIYGDQVIAVVDDNETIRLNTAHTYCTEDIQILHVLPTAEKYLDKNIYAKSEVVDIVFDKFTIDTNSMNLVIEGG